MAGYGGDYFDHGDPIFECKELHALVWEAEAKRGNNNTTNKAYSICCGKGKVFIKQPPPAPKPLVDLYFNDDAKSKNFKNNIRTYNSMFAFTSMGVKVDDSINRKGKGPYVFHLHGQTYHSMGSLLPKEGESPKFAQLYIYDTENEVENRARALREVKDVLDTSSDLVKTFRRACDRYNEDAEQNIRIKLVAKRDLFITVTCNPNWPEISRYMREHNLSSTDRHDVLTRLFKMKLDQLMKDVKELHLFGRTQAVVYTIEFQKRGLPHTHVCLFLHKDDKVPNADQIDKYISAEIPDKDDDPDLYKLVSDFMMHGPCGVDEPNQACMADGKCTKHFPKKFTQRSSVDVQEMGWQIVHEEYEEHGKRSRLWFSTDVLHVLNKDKVTS
ncbi:ATP-dependent DNA helicase PIF1-like protein [Tanacetum coccineum]